MRNTGSEGKLQVTLIDSKELKVNLGLKHRPQDSRILSIILVLMLSAFMMGVDLEDIGLGFYIDS